MYYIYSDFNYGLETPKKIGKVVKETPWKEWFSWKTLSGALDEYCKEGSLHGLKYLRNPELSIVERLLWLFLFSNAVYWGVTSTWGLYKDMMDNQVEMSFNPISTQIWDIPFPAIMICPANPVRKSFFNLNTSTNQSDSMYYSKMLCPNKENFGFENYNRAIDEKFFIFMHDAAIPCENMFKRCTWNNKKIDCCSRFKPVISKGGHCYLFNHLPGSSVYRNFTPAIGDPAKDSNDGTEYWHISAGYPNRIGGNRKKILPLWSERMGHQYGLTLELMENWEEHQEECSGSSNEYNIRVLSSVESTELGTSLVGLESGHHTFIKLDPNLIMSEEGLRLVPVDQRSCLFHNEGNLKYFKNWSQSSCFIDCFITNLLSVCKCVPFDLQRAMGAFNPNFCTYSQMSCVFSNLLKLMQSQKTTGGLECNCLPLCSTLSYDYQTSSQPIVTSQTKPFRAKGYNKSLEADIAQVSVFFPQAEFSSLTRVNTASFSAFMGNAGGLLGVLLGYSFMSGFEIIYFAVIKPIVRVIIYFSKRNKVHNGQ